MVFVVVVPHYWLRVLVFGVAFKSETHGVGFWVSDHRSFEVFLFTCRFRKFLIHFEQIKLVLLRMVLLLELHESEQPREMDAEMLIMDRRHCSFELKYSLLQVLRFNGLSICFVNKL